MNAGAQPGWFSRNWKWMVPLLVVGACCVCTGLLGAIFAAVTGAIRSSDVYQYTLQKASHDPRVTAVTGEPVEAGMMASGSVNTSNDSGQANLSIPIHGPRGAGRVSVTAHKAGGAWTYNTMVFQPDGAAAPINLLP